MWGINMQLLGQILVVFGIFLSTILALIPFQYERLDIAYLQMIIGALISIVGAILIFLPYF